MHIINNCPGINDLAFHYFVALFPLSGSIDS